jgi:hypothetical protein
MLEAGVVLGGAGAILADTLTPGARFGTGTRAEVLGDEVEVVYRAVAEHSS